MAISLPWYLIIFQVFKWTKYFVPLKYFSPDENLMCYAYLCLIYCSESYGRANYIQSLCLILLIFISFTVDQYVEIPLLIRAKDITGWRLASWCLVIHHLFLALNHFLFKRIKVLQLNFSCMFAPYTLRAGAPGAYWGIGGSLVCSKRTVNVIYCTIWCCYWLDSKRAVPAALLIAI